ncbi:MAG: MFS transporter [Dehalococcoidia bacterium]|nr:MFS transporter [Dehalococcoidia bacterium]
MAAGNTRSEVRGATDEGPLPRWGALAYPNYRNYWIANLVRIFGIQFRFIGGLWLVQQLADSPLWLGVLSISTAVPTIVLSVPAGALADRVDNQKLLVWSSALTAVVTGALAVAVVLDVANVWIAVLWAAVLGALMALANPAQSAILPRLIDMRAIASAVAYTSAAWSGMRIVGPFAVGILIAVIGTGQAFIVTAAAFAISALLLQRLRLAPVERRGTHAEHDGGMLEGARYIFRNKLFLATIGLSFFTSVFGSSYIVLLPTFADDILHVGARGFGLMETAAGMGALLGTFLIVRVRSQRHYGPVMLLAAAAFGILIAGFAASRTIGVSMALLFGGGLASAVYLNVGMTTLQVLVPDELRGRVMGVWSMTYFLGSVGGLPAGLVAAWLGAPVAVAAGGLSVTAFAVALLVTVPALRELARPSAVPSRA